MNPLEITILGIPIEFVILGLGLASIAAFSAVLCSLTNKVEALTERVTTLEHLLGEMVSRRVDAALTQGVRDLNEVGRS